MGGERIFFFLTDRFEMKRKDGKQWKSHNRVEMSVTKWKRKEEKGGKKRLELFSPRGAQWVSTQWKTEVSPLPHHGI